MRLTGLMLVVAASIARGEQELGVILPPHPQITEVLFNVPTESIGDANRDGVRHAAGDEFIEVANPHDSPVNMRGYVLFNRRSSFGGSGGGGVRFGFPDFTLPAHGVCVLFNGCEATLQDPFGTAGRPPEKGNPEFAGALLFSMENPSKQRAMNNSGDWIVLAAPDGTIIDCVFWGDPDPPPPKSVRTQKVEANPKGSVQRLGPTLPLEPHRAIDGEPFSPGVIPERTKAPRKK
jgi:hypothetical protein